MRQIYRNIALERLSSPEQLDMLMQVTDPRGWLALLGVSLLLVTGVVWSVVAQLPIELSTPIVLNGTADSHIYLSPEDSQQVRVGMPVEVFIQGGVNDWSVNGRIESIGEFPEQDMPTPVENPIELHVVFDNLPDGLPDSFAADATIQIGTQRPFQFIIPAARVDADRNDDVASENRVNDPIIATITD